MFFFICFFACWDLEGVRQGVERRLALGVIVVLLKTGHGV